MHGRNLRSLRWTLGACALGAALGWTRAGHAQEHSIISHPGDHPNYSVEIEPHVLAGVFAPLGGTSGFGLGGRFSIPVMQNGFVPSINNNVAIGFGLDWLHYNGCWGRYNYFGCADLNGFWFPVVMQWNFFLSTHWSVFGEPGIALYYADWGPDCYNVDPRTTVCDAYTPSRLNFQPFVLFLGGRFHASEKVALTGRIGWPYFSFGVSFFP